MMRWMPKARSGLVRILETVVVLLMGALVIDVLWQVVSRYIARRPSSWTDELATLLVIWLALLGASAAFGRHAHLGVDFLVRQLSPGLRRCAEVLVQGVVACFAVVILILGGAELVRLTLLTEQVSPALGVKMGHVYLALPISGLFIVLFAVEGLVGSLTRRVSGQGSAESNRDGAAEIKEANRE